MDAKELKEQLEAVEKAKPINFLTSHITSIIEPLNVPTLTIPNDLVLPDNIPIYHYEIDNSIMYNPSSALVDLDGTIKNGAHFSVPVIQSSVELCVDSDPLEKIAGIEMGTDHVRVQNNVPLTKPNDNPSISKVPDRLETYTNSDKMFGLRKLPSINNSNPTNQAHQKTIIVKGSKPFKILKSPNTKGTN
ncbi:uncharacterized protein LOC120906269 [Anopheles arabiensis]|uniref:uncharacterized protein LOC120906269 n=1 Tax=Anopheles arabiensis TaxID=7173 RepID=UPI001AAD5452|nr:uncharacterized protein LOC120906269 [Anopheles arabiensis]